MSGPDDLTAQASKLAERLRRARATPGRGGTPDAGELAALESRLSSLWTAIRAARALPGAPDAAHWGRTRPKWG